ncbi:MAG: extracellular solute-binding protein [Clostridia bacterium]|nr:extracellular solute-binding protein [Clostridia bacterium]
MKKRRIVCGALACLLGVATVGSFASCTGAGGNVILVKYMEGGYGGGMMRHWKEEFEELHPEYRVVLEGSNTMTQDFLTHLSTGSNLGDVYMVLETGWQKEAAAGKLASLDDVYKAPADYGTTGGDTIADFMQDSLLEYGKLNSPLAGDHYYAIPWSDGPTGIVYNKTMFETYGWEIPETVDELVELCNTINAAKVPTGNTKQPYVKPFAIYGAYGDYIGETWWLQYEGAENFRRFFAYETITDESGAQNPVGYLQQGRVEALKAFEELFFAPTADEYHSFGKKNMTLGVSTHTGAQQDFGNKYAAMIVEGAWMESEGATYLDGSFEYEMMPTPYVDGAIKDETTGEYKQVLASQAGDFMCVPNAANNVKGAIEFLKYVNSRQGCESYTRATGGAMRPYEYKASEVSGVRASGFMESCWRVYENSQVSYHYSTSPMQWSNKLGKWAGATGVYDAIVIGKECTLLGDGSIDKTSSQAVNICQKCYDYALREWDAIYDEIS